MRQKVFIFCLVWLIAGCTASSVAHLDSNPLSFDREEQLSMRYWEFEYVTKVDNDQYLLQGKARLQDEGLPGVGEWIHNLRLSAHLSDEEGRVLASDSRAYSTRKRKPQTEVMFDFSFHPEHLPASQDIFVTFGYSMQLTDHRYRDARHESPLFGETSAFRVREGALLR